MANKPQQKMSMSEVARVMKEAAPELKDVPDDVLLRKMIEKHPDILQRVFTSDPRTGAGAHKAPEDEPVTGGATGRFFKGMGAPLKGLGTVKGAASFMFPGVMGPIQGMQDELARSKMSPEAAQDSRKDQLAGLVDLPNIGNDIARGDWAHAAGRATTAGIPLGTGLAGAVGKAGKLSSGARMAEFEAATESIAAPVRATLDEQIAGIDKAMNNKLINTQKFSADAAFAQKIIEKTSRAPAAKQMDVSAAKAVVDQLRDRMKGGKQINWTDARQAYKDLGSAASKLPPSDLKTKLFDIREALKTELSSVAKAAGEPGFDKWVKDYADYSDWARDYAKVLKGQTEQQMRTKATAKDAPALKALGTTVRTGRTRVGKMRNENSRLIEGAHAKLDQLHKRIKEVPAKKGQPALPTPAANPPAGEPF